MTTPRRLLVGLIILAAIILLPSVARGDNLDDYASTLVGHTVTVECFPSNGVWGGYVYLTDPTVVYLDGAFCGVLRHALAPTGRTGRFLATTAGGGRLGAAVMTLTHEAMHLALNSADEGHVECVAARNVWQSVRILPLPFKLKVLTWQWAVANHESLHEPDYRTEC